MAIDWKKVDEVTLALLTLTAFKVGAATGAWKGHDWDVLSRLHGNGWISNPVGKAKSVILTPGGEALAKKLFAEHFGSEPAARRGQRRAKA